MRTDLTLFDRHENPLALIEVKNKRGTDASWATRFRQNLLAHGDLPGARFFLIITPDRIYLWDRNFPIQEQPYSLDWEILPPEPTQRGNGTPLSAQGFEFLVASRLGELLLKPPESEKVIDDDGNLLATLVAAGQGGHVEFEHAA